ncbi:MAG: hypothetical protein AAF614_00275 [Chloroflexota bacterium]
MKHKFTQLIILVSLSLLALVGCTSGAAGRALDYASQTVAVADINQYFSMLLHGNTLNIFHFEEQDTVLLINLPNESADLTLTVTVHIFDDAETPETIGQWINNQYSDALFPEVPEPIESIMLDDAGHTFLSTTLVGQESGQFGDEYDVYDVEYRINEMAEEGQFTLNEFTYETVVYVMTKDIDG